MVGSNTKGGSSSSLVGCGAKWRTTGHLPVSCVGGGGGGSFQLVLESLLPGVDILLTFFHLLLIFLPLGHVLVKLLLVGVVFVLFLPVMILLFPLLVLDVKFTFLS